MSWDWFVFSVNWHCQRHQGSAVTYTGRCGILNMFFLCWVSTNIHSWHPLAWLVIDSLTGTGHWEKMYIGFRLCAGHCCHPLFDTVAAEWECVEENDPSHPAAFRPYSAVRMRMCGREWPEPSCCLQTLLCCQDENVWKRMTRAILLPSDPTLLSGWECVEENDPSHPAAFRPYSAVRMRMCGREWPEPSCCLQTLLCCQDENVWKRMTRAILLPSDPTLLSGWECVEENDPSHPAAFRPYSAVRMRMCGREWPEPSCCLQTLLCCQDENVWKRMTRAILLPSDPTLLPSDPTLLPSDPTLLSGRTWSSLCLLMAFFTTVGPGVLSCPHPNPQPTPHPHFPQAPTPHPPPDQEVGGNGEVLRDPHISDTVLFMPF